ncbi:MAG: hypothetical protein KA712_24715 [Myxococcales bacterium]|nr:hypothetical protein [Myxococcales bacterium]
MLKNQIVVGLTALAVSGCVLNCSGNNAPHRSDAAAQGGGSGATDTSLLDASFDADAEGNSSTHEVAPDGRDGSAQETGPSETCLAGWSEKSLVFTAKPPLAVAPKVAWTKKLVDFVATGDRVVSGNGFIATTAANIVLSVDKQSQMVRGWRSELPELFTSLSLGKDGNILVAGSRAYGIAPDGTRVWQVPLSGPPLMDEWTKCGSSYSSAANTLFTLCNTGYLHAIVPAQQETKWSQRIYEAGFFDSFMRGGGGDSLLLSLSERLNKPGIRAYDARSGQAMGAVVKDRASVSAFYSGGMLTVGNTMAAYDKCGNLRWSADEEGTFVLPVVTGLPDERIFAIEGSGTSTAERSLSMYSSTSGTRLASRGGLGTPVAAGADGTYYAFDCEVRGSTEPRPEQPALIAFNSGLQEKWRLQLPVPKGLGNDYPCPKWGVALDDDGMMYMAVEANSTHIIAVQTTSPGPAPTLWPLRFGDNAGSSWSQ